MFSAIFNRVCRPSQEVRTSFLTQFMIIDLTSVRVFALLFAGKGIEAFSEIEMIYVRYRMLCSFSCTLLLEE